MVMRTGSPFASAPNTNFTSSNTFLLTSLPVILSVLRSITGISLKIFSFNCCLEYQDKIVCELVLMNSILLSWDLVLIYFITFFSLEETISIFFWNLIKLMSLRIYLKFIILDFIPLLFLPKKTSILRFFYTFFVKKRGISPSDLRLIKLS